MEKEIEILEELVKNIKRVNESTLDCEIEQWCKEKQAIENLIKGYKEKEESEAYLYDAYQDAGKKMFEYAEKCDELEKKDNFYKDLEKKYFEVSKELSAINNDYFKLKSESIPKSKVKEMIEEKQKRIDTMHPASDCVLIDDLENQIEVLQELMEDK